MQKIKRISAFIAATALAGASALTLAGCAGGGDQTVVLRVCSWEEYIDLGGWDESEVIDLDSGNIFGENSMVDDFTEWFNGEDFGFNVRVEYSTFGTNEDLYNRLSLGDVYDLVCPSDYMIMKLLAEEKVEKYSDGFFDKTDKNNYYVNNVSPYISEVFSRPEYSWTEYAACYMWGTTGIVYNPEKVAAEDVSTWEILRNPIYKRQVTVKDNVRDAYFATLGIINSEKLCNPDFNGDRNALLNNTDGETIAAAEDVLKQIKDNVYSFETDAGKADMVTGKVVANYQWSGDAVYIMDEAEKDGTELWYSVPDECTNLWFDGWLMLKDGIGDNANRKTAAEAFVNFLSKPENAVRNMYYIGYTSAIAGDTVFEYMDWNYGAKTEDTVEYDLSYFFGSGKTLNVDAGNFEFEDEEKKITNRGRQLFAQYPPANVMQRSVVMVDFGDKLSEINQMWINVRCLDLKDISPVTVGIVAGVVGVLAIGICLYAFRYRIFIKHRPKKGYYKVEE